MKLILTFIILVLSIVSTQASVRLVIPVDACITQKSDLYEARFTTHKKGYEGKRCWHSTIKFKSRVEMKKKYAEFKQVMKEFNEWKHGQALKCYFHTDDCNPIINSKLDKLL